MIDLVVREDRRRAMVYVRQKKNRGEFTVQLVPHRCETLAGKVTGVMVILEDITELKTTPGRTAAVRRAVSRAGRKHHDILYATDEQGVITYIARR